MMKEKTLYQKLSQQEKEELNSFIKKYQDSFMTLAEIFQVAPEPYRFVSLEELGMSDRVISALKTSGRGHYFFYDQAYFKTDDLFDLLNCSVFKLLYISNIGKAGIMEIIALVKKFTDEHKEINPEQLAVKLLQKLLEVICSGKKTISEIISMLE